MKVIIIMLLIGLLLFMGRNMKNDWYVKPNLQPPNFLFPIIWLFLYFSFVVIYSRIQTNYVFYIIIISLGLQMLWLYLFNQINYQKSKLVLGMIVIVSFLLINATKIDNISFFLSLLYIIWVSFAFYLNLNITVSSN